VHTARSRFEVVLVKRQQLNVAVPMLYGILVVAAVLFFKSALVGVAVIGGMLVGLYYTVWGRGGQEGRRRR